MTFWVDFRTVAARLYTWECEVEYWSVKLMLEVWDLVDLQFKHIHITKVIFHNLTRYPPLQVLYCVSHIYSTDCHAIASTHFQLPPPALQLGLKDKSNFVFNHTTSLHSQPPLFPPLSYSSSCHYPQNFHSQIHYVLMMYSYLSQGLVLRSTVCISIELPQN